MNIFSVEELKMEAPCLGGKNYDFKIIWVKKLCNFCRQNELHHKTKNNNEKKNKKLSN